MRIREAVGNTSRYVGLDGSHKADSRWSPSDHGAMQFGKKEESEVYLSAAVASASKYWLICLYGRKDKALAVLIRSAWQTSGNK